VDKIKNFWGSLPRALRIVLMVGAVLFLFSQVAKAETWTLDRMNNHIDQTNFIVGSPANCSATLISVEQRLLLTNHHCIEQYIKKETRQVIGADGQIDNVEYERFDGVPVSQKVYSGHEVVSSLNYQMEIVGYSKDYDLGLLRFKAETIPNTIHSKIFTGGSIERGEEVYAVGNPLGLDATLTKGIISSVNRRLEVEGTEHDYLQMDAGIAGGNSGGALYNASGELIGVPAAAASGTMIGLSIPAESIIQFLKDNCYDIVVDPAAKGHEVCVEELDDEEESKE